MKAELETCNEHNPVVIRVDDDEHVTFLLDFLLERNGYTVIKANDGQEFMDILDIGLPPDLILLDLMLPYIDGFELIKRIRKKNAWENIPILILSGSESEKDIVHGLNAGANDYMVKPFQPMELIARIERLLGSNNETNKTS